MVVRAPRVEAEDPKYSSGPWPVPLESFDRAGLARAVPAEKGDDLARLGRQVQTVHRGQISISDHESEHFDGGRVAAGHAARRYPVSYRGRTQDSPRPDVPGPGSGVRWAGRSRYPSLVPDAEERPTCASIDPPLSPGCHRARRC